MLAAELNLSAKRTEQTERDLARQRAGGQAGQPAPGLGPSAGPETHVGAAMIRAGSPGGQHPPGTTAE